MEGHPRIEANPAILGGKPVIHGTRIPVYLLLNLIAEGMTFDEIIADYTDLTPEDVKAAVAYASEVVQMTDWVEYGVA